MPKAIRAPVLVALLLALAAGALLWPAGDRRFGPPSWWEALDPPAPQACSEDDPTGSGCLTLSGRRLHDDLVARFGEVGPDRPMRSMSCWSAHSWNPTSDHPAGRACDVFPGRSGVFLQGADLADGWAVAHWLQEHAEDLRIRYIIWQGRIWYGGFGGFGGFGGGDHAADDGWGRPYTGGGIYDPTDASGGHFDHVHVSVRP